MDVKSQEELVPFQEIYEGLRFLDGRHAASLGEFLLQHFIPRWIAEPLKQGGEVIYAPHFPLGEVARLVAEWRDQWTRVLTVSHFEPPELCIDKKMHYWSLSRVKQLSHWAGQMTGLKRLLHDRGIARISVRLPGCACFKSYYLSTAVRRIAGKETQIAPF